MKKLVAKVGEYTNNSGETKGRYVNLGVIMDGKDGQYILMDPFVDTGTAYCAQQTLNASQGKAPSDRLMVSLFEDQGNQQQQAPQQQAPQQQQAYPQNNQQPVNGYQAPQSNQYQGGQGYNGQ